MINFPIFMQIQKPRVFQFASTSEIIVSFEMGGILTDSKQ